ncbi:MAG: response regulator transcription factor [Clostridia bacterium]
MYRVMIVEDDAVIAFEISESLAKWGFEAHIARDFQNVTDEISVFDPHLVLMDISLPYFNGYYWCSQLRAKSNIPVIFLSSRADNMDVVMAINMGADDYITKPVAMDVLIAKIQAMLRRSYDYEASVRLTLRGAHFDCGAACLIIDDGSRVELTRNEARILQLLLANKGAIVSREQLMLKIWDSDEFIDDNTLTVNVNRLRKTLDGAALSDCISTHKGLGYSIDE